MPSPKMPAYFLGGLWNTKVFVKRVIVQSLHWFDDSNNHEKNERIALYCYIGNENVTLGS